MITQRNEVLAELCDSRRSWSSMVAIGLIACLTVLPLLACVGPQRPHESQGATIVVTPVSGVAKTPIKVIGAGFVPGETVEVSLSSENLTTVLGGRGGAPGGKVTVNEVGAFFISSSVPRAVKPSVYTIEANGDKGSVATAPLVIEEKKKK